MLKGAPSRPEFNSTLSLVENITKESCINSTYQFAVLGMSLSNLFDIQNAQDLLRGLISTLAEYDQSKEDNYKPKMVKIFHC